MTFSMFSVGPSLMRISIDMVGAVVTCYITARLIRTLGSRRVWLGLLAACFPLAVYLSALNWGWVVEPIKLDLSYTGMSIGVFLVSRGRPEILAYDIGLDVDVKKDRKRKDRIRFAAALVGVGLYLLAEVSVGGLEL